MWRAAQMQRFTKTILDGRARGEQNQQDAEILRQGIWLVLHIVFIKVPLHNEAGLTLSATEKTRLSTAIDIIANQLIVSTRAQNFTKQYRSIFENKTDCRTVKQSMMAALAQSL